MLLATHNAGKVREFAELLREAPVRFIGLDEVGITESPEETGETFEENAILKATTYARLSGRWCLSEDSGIEVDALGGAPGPLSHRFAGIDATDPERIQYLLDKLRGVPGEQRGARFRSVIAVAAPEGRHWIVQGEIRGVIARQPMGTGGFGYDPVFFVPELGKTTAQLSLAEKNRVSHRSRAAAKAVALLQELRQQGALQ